MTTKWKPMQRAVAKPPTQELVEATMKALDCNEVAARAHLDAEMKDVQLYINDLYQVEVRIDWPNASAHLNIRRRDGFPGRDWRHFQQIKNELLGPQCEAIELYPAESRLVDTSNKYHLYGCLDPTFRFPIGWKKRDVSFESSKTTPGMRQRPALEIEAKPIDAMALLEACKLALAGFEALEEELRGKSELWTPTILAMDRLRAEIAKVERKE